MNEKEFVVCLRTTARDAAVDGVISVITDPPGRRPAAELLELSRWYSQLPELDRDRLRRLMNLVAHQALFGVLAVIDGSRQVEATLGAKGHFEVRHVDAAGAETMIAGPGTAPLHELL